MEARFRPEDHNDPLFRTLRILHLHLLENAQMDAAHVAVQRQVSALESERALLSIERDELQKEQVQLRADEAALASVEAQLKAEKALLDWDREWLRGDQQAAQCEECQAGGGGEPSGETGSAEPETGLFLEVLSSLLESEDGGEQAEEEGGEAQHTTLSGQRHEGADLERNADEEPLHAESGEGGPCSSSSSTSTHCRATLTVSGPVGDICSGQHRQQQQEEEEEQQQLRQAGVEAENSGSRDPSGGSSSSHAAAAAVAAVPLLPPPPPCALEQSAVQTHSKGSAGGSAAASVAAAGQAADACGGSASAEDTGCAEAATEATAMAGSSGSSIGPGARPSPPLLPGACCRVASVARREAAVVALIQRAIAAHRVVLRRCDAAAQRFHSLVERRDAVAQRYAAVLALKRGMIEEMRRFKAEREREMSGVPGWPEEA